ncbi:hypothetical protein C8A05DRAFT_39459 [Staphylotrichum tortipilum]|uniref:Uncharacterized protein n=1 Tax=Staphylotrichum tortipilum TaxID=2831512 RepID=A0AAN6RNB1_9PEZI|nr:hypothetical protein C8A05DRAFT_39459 [Staphylotrichum longicolle]
MKFAASIHIILVFLLGLVAGLALPGQHPRAPSQYAMMDFRRRTACHSILTNCRTEADCCSGLRCDSFDGEAFCVPAG